MKTPNEKTLGEVKKAYIEGIKKKILELKKFVDKRNLFEVQRLGHSLKGSGAMYGYPEISALGEKMESLAKSENWMQLKQIIKELEAIHEKIKEKKMSRTILVIEDDPDINALIKITLQSAGYGVVSVLGGKNGLRKTKERKVDVILLDIIMPEMDGYEVIKNLKLSKTTKDIPVVFFSAKTEKEDIEKGLSLNAAGYIKKPFDIEKLPGQIEKFIQIQ